MKGAGQSQTDFVSGPAKRGKQIAVARIEYLKTYNGMKITPHERKDSEVFYMKLAYGDYLKQMKVEKESDRKVLSMEDQDMAEYMVKQHPRFYDLAHMYDFTLDMVNLKTEAKNMASQSAKIEMNHILPDGSTKKSLSRKLLVTMTVSALKAMISKLFKVETIHQQVSYRGLEDTVDYPVDEEYSLGKWNEKVNLFNLFNKFKQ